MERPISNVILTGTPIEEHVERFMTVEDKKALPIRNTAKIGLKWSNKWLKDLNKDKYRRLERQTKCDHCKTPWRLGTGPPLSCKGSLEGQWTCSECAGIVETGYYCTMGCPLYVCGTVIPGTQSDRTDMFVDYEEQIKLNCKEYEEKLEMDHMTDAYRIRPWFGNNATIQPKVHRSNVFSTAATTSTGMWIQDGKNAEA
jgi:hypothetical protein